MKTLIYSLQTKQLYIILATVLFLTACKNNSENIKIEIADSAKTEEKESQILKIKF